MPTPVRLLGFAFANADFLFEIDAEGSILFTAGAAKDLVQEKAEALVGRPAGQLFKPSEGVKFVTFVKALKNGDRTGPYKLTLATGQDANLSLFRLPDNNSRVSCTLSRPGARTSMAPQIDPRTGLATQDGFLAAANMAAATDTLTLVEIPGLKEVCAKLAPDAADKLMLRIGELFKQAGATSAGQLSETRFGALAPESRGALGMASLVKNAIAEGGGGNANVKEVQVSLRGGDLSNDQRLLAMRYTLDQFAAKGRVAAGGDMAAVFGSMLDDTQRRLAEMTKVVGEGAFEIAYQPIVHLGTNTTSHYEALARFANKEGTGDTIKFIEALGISNGFDLALTQKILSMVENDTRKEVEVAFNVSGATIASPASFGMLAGMLARKRKLAPRVLIEITETSEITDLESAAVAVAALRALGYRVGLDDFGAGAASLNYLHAFQIDFVKFDGALVKKIGTSQRDDALLGGLTKLCGELGVATIAECIETEAMAKAAKALGFDKGQGKHLGAPALDIPSEVGRGRRQGVRESWG
jgi:EAL domain-containing protein (putative c-di-GMP-specific phosphodiesterase class I)